MPLAWTCDADCTKARPSSACSCSSSSASHVHAKGMYDGGDADTDNGLEPSAKDDKDAPTAYEVDVAVDREGDAEKDEQEQAEEGLAFVQSGSHVHAKGMYDG